MHSFLLSPTPNHAPSHSAVSSVMFFDRNTSMSTDVGFRLVCRLLTISPALENSLSEGTEVAGFPSTSVSGAQVQGTQSRVSRHHTWKYATLSKHRLRNTWIPNLNVHWFHDFKKSKWVLSGTQVCNGYPVNRYWNGYPGTVPVLSTNPFSPSTLWFYDRNSILHLQSQ